jgi:Rieske Fe-S protein
VLLGGFGACAALALVRSATGCTPGSNLDTATVVPCGGGLCINLNDPTNAALTKVGGAMLVNGNGDTMMVIRTAETEVVALDAICTHLGCTLSFDSKDSQLVCPCHGAKFNEMGSAISGPTTTPLTVFSAILVGSSIEITS